VVVIVIVIVIAVVIATVFSFLPRSDTRHAQQHRLGEENRTKEEGRETTTYIGECVSSKKKKKEKPTKKKKKVP
jgi:hypothetical protein